MNNRGAITVPLDSGTRLGPYQILALLGSGGMGEVYRADDSRLGRSVAIKVLPPEVSSDPVRRVRFEREARAIAALNHPHICAVHDIGRQNGVDYLVMELLDGESLADRLARGALPFAEASPIAFAIVETLAAVHERGLIHRDLKPANIFLTRHGVKLLDFGLARDVGPAEAVDTRLTQQGLVVGTPKYLAPEQLRGQAVDHRSDIFAAGAVIYEMLTGRAAFEAPSLVDILHAVAFEHPPALPADAAPAPFAQAVRQALAKAPDERPPDAVAFASALRAGSSTGTGAVSVPAAPAPTLTRLIVLPFRLLRSDPDTDFLAFSLPDAVSAALSGLESVVVRSSLSAAPPAGAPAPDLRALAQQASVDAVVTGSLLRVGSEVRVSAQLVAVPEGSLLWSHTIQAPVHDLFQLQDALTNAIVSALHVPLSAHDRRALRQDVPASPTGYELFLRANTLASESSHWIEARALYERAVEIDPGYAPAWARLGRMYRVTAKYGGAETRADSVRAERAFERALALNPGLTTAHYLYAHLEAETGRGMEAMVRLLRRARSRSADPELLAGLVLTCRYCGLLDESIAAYQRVQRLDAATHTSVTYAYYMLGDYQQAIATDTSSMAFGAVLARMRAGDVEHARPVLLAMEQDNPHEGVRLISSIYRLAIDGDVDALLPRLETMATSGFADPEGYFLLAPFVARAGADAAALAALERAVAGGYSSAYSLRHDPYWDAVRHAPAFVRLRDKAEAAQAAARQAFDGADGNAILHRAM